jgi:hypothetical protein
MPLGRAATAWANSADASGKPPLVDAHLADHLQRLDPPVQLLGAELRLGTAAK